MDFGGNGEIEFEQRGRAGVITLNRPKALNALTHNMVLALTRALDAWARDQTVKQIVITGRGRAFSAGGDIAAIYAAGKAGNPPRRFFADEYRLNERIKAFPKPYIAIIDGIVMGGGVGVSVHGTHRVFTENARFAMPEVSIGFFPDVGGSHFLPRLPGRFGYWLALTGSRIKWGDALWSGLATSAVPAARLEEMVANLCEQDPDSAISRYRDSPLPETDENERKTIERLFSSNSLEAIFKELEKTGGDFAQGVLQAMRKSSPTSLHVAFRQITKGGSLSMRECMEMEYRIVNRMLDGHEFFEGIRAAVIDKDAQPQWEPATVEEVDPADIDRYFAALAEDELSWTRAEHLKTA